MVLETEHSILRGQQTTYVSKGSPIVVNEMKEPASVDDCLEVVVSWIERTLGKSYFVVPLEDFQAKYGKVNPEDEFYQARMNYFLEHCVLERPMTGDKSGQISPVMKFFETHSSLTQGDDCSAELWGKFSGFRHGIFEVIKSGSEVILVRDLINDQKFKIVPKSGETLKYLRRKSIFQGFLFGGIGEKVLGQGLIVHPDAATKEILKFIKKYKKYPSIRPSDLLKMFANTNMRFLRMQHVDPTIIYSSISG